MPKCSICHQFFVRPQSFNTLLSFYRQCVICETLLKSRPNQSVLPLEYNILEVTTYQHGDHPALTHKYFTNIIAEKTGYLYYQPEWERHPETLILLGKLFQPLKIFYHQGIEQKIINLLEKIEVYT